MRTADLFGENQKHDPGCKRLLPIPSEWRVGATFDGDNDEYRYTLEYVWDESRPLVGWSLMNPSGATPRHGDMTVMRTASISKRWGYGGQIIVNACALRGTQPSMLLTYPDPAGPRNLTMIRIVARSVGMIVVAHGKLPGGLQHHAEAMVRALREARPDLALHVLGLSGDGTPLHPLTRGKLAVQHGIPGSVQPIPWTPPYL